MRQMTEQAVEAHDISKRVGAVTAVDGLSLTLEPGTARGLLGPGGSGPLQLADEEALGRL